MGTTASFIDPLNYSPPPTPPQRMMGCGSMDCDDDSQTVPLYGSCETKHTSKPRFRRESFAGCLFDPELLTKAEFLSRNEWDRQVFIRYVLGEYWRGRVCPDLRRDLAFAGRSNNSRGLPPMALPLKNSKSFTEDTVSSHLSFSLEDLLKIFSVTQCRAMLLASVLFSFFLFRRDVDFDVVFDEHSPSLPSAMKTLSTTDETHLAHDTLYEENGEFFLDPENVLSLISMSCTVEDLDQLLVDSCWINHYISAIEDIKLAVSVEDVSTRPRPLTADQKRPVPSLLTVSAPTPCSCTGSVSNPVVFDVPYLLFENKANQCLTMSQRESLQGLCSKNKSAASKGHVCLSQAAENKHKSASHFLASLYVNDHVLIETEKCGKMTVEDASKADTVSADEDEEASQPHPRYLVTLLHRITGALHEKNSLRLADFVLFSISAALSPR